MRNCGYRIGVTLTAGVDMGGTKIETAVIRDSRPIGQPRLPTHKGGPAAVLKAVVETVASAAAAAGIKPEQLQGIGVGFPGVYDQATGDVIKAPNIAGFQRRYPLGTRISEAFGAVPVVLDNDVRAAMVGEHRAGAGRTEAGGGWGARTGGAAGDRCGTSSGSSWAPGLEAD